jgi:cytochrome c oxidase subunit II
MVLARLGAFWATLAATALAPAAAFADKPQEWEWGFQEPATPVMEAVVQLHDKLLWIIIIISIFVLGLLVYVMVRFNEKRNPTPSRTTHNTTIEVLWTVIPVLILLFIAFGPPMSSFRLLYLADRAPDATMTVKAIGHQWYWEYEYPDNGGISITSSLNDKATPELRLLDTDTHIVVPVNTKIRLLTTAQDVIHAWAMPSFGVKLDAVPGRINETWFEVLHEGTYYGQCSELCGNGHGYMPIVVEAVSKDKFDAWVQKNKAALNGGAPATTVAAVESSN